MSDTLEKDLDQGRVVLGGCVIDDSFQPDFYCNKCKFQWDARYPEKGHYEENDERISKYKPMNDM